ncbi:hypothetical protein SAMN06269185_1245 [Natronoarchaeum philippinense]|uniref:Uncharacterized protein n=1 Tax=Natronoarchaeum philippinense TaxID=558529 RepID=A0A285NG83_NATPI|nr:helix-turn-helix domain-containing protein [Natronoarchaeum philippinense]SNZ06661.1 hypothetical protein SAMN06269185_1245 [Natronoarchaeum philippinense]
MTPPTDDSTVDAALRAVLRITPDSDAACGVLSAASEESVSVRGGVSGGAEVGAACHADVAVEGDRRLVSDAATGECICPVFADHRCVPRVERAVDGAVVVRLSVPDRETLRSVVADLRDRGAGVELERLNAGADAEGAQTVELDAGEITDKQREAIRVADRLGYYDTPREADLGEVAAELGISRSAASQRLNGAASTLVLELIRAESGDSRADG